MPGNSGISAMKSRTKEFGCNTCGLVLSRQDHLERHRKTAHGARDAHTACPCTECDRTFSRRDVLLRHYRVIHGIKCLPRPKGRPKLSRKAREEKERQNDSNEKRPTIELNDAEKTCSTNNSSLDKLDASTASHIEDGNPSGYLRLGNVRAVLDEANAMSPALMSALPPFDTGTMSLEGKAWEDFDQALSLFDWMNEEGASMPYSFDLPEINLPDPSVELHDAQIPTPFSFPEGASLNNISAEAEKPVQLPTPQTAGFQDDSCSQYSGKPQPGESCSPLNALPQPVPMDRCSSSDPWPLEWHASKTEQRVALPTLSSSDSEVLNSLGGADTKLLSWDMQLTGGTDRLDNSKRLNIVELLSIPFERIPWQEDTTLLHSLPNADILNHFVDLYFLQFHEFWPIIHRPTFKVSQAPTILILSMACIGACYSGLDNSIEFAQTLAELCRRTSTWMAEYDTQFVRSPFYGIALLLQYIHAVGSGSRRLLEMADSSRSRLISIGRYMNLFGGPQSTPAPVSPTVGGQSLYQNWLEWVEREQIKRLAWFLFEFDCLYTAYSKQTPCIKLEETPSELPCEHLFWEAPTAYAWSASLPWPQTVPRCQQTLHTIQSLLKSSGHSQTPVTRVDPASKRLLMRYLGRLLESCQEQIDSSIHKLLWKNSGPDSVARAARTQVSVTIMDLYETIWEDVSHAINLRPTMRVAVAAHYSHMFAAGRIVDVITRAARIRAAGMDATSSKSISSSISNDDPGTAVHDGTQSTGDFVSHFSTLFNNDPQTAREMVWHASQVFCLQRRYPFNSPHEPLSVFLAGITLWAFAKFFRPVESNPLSVNMQLDVPPFCASHDATKIRNEWIKHGGRASLEGAGDLSAPQAPARILALCGDMTQRLKVWGMASKISAVFFRMLQREEEESGLRTSP